MPLHYQLNNYKMWVNKLNNTVLLVQGEEIYYDFLRDAFPDFRFSPSWPDQYGSFEWGTYINHITEDDRSKISDLLELFKTSVCIDDALDQTFALDYHTRSFYGRTETGDLVYQAKYQNNHDAIEALLNAFRGFILRHPSYSCADFIVAAPPSNAKKWSLANYLGENLCLKLEIENGNKYIQKIRQTQPMKDLETEEEKFNNITGAFEINQNAPFQGKRVILVDDIYHSGMTLHELATTLERSQALVLGLVATKTLRDVN